MSRRLMMSGGGEWLKTPHDLTGNTGHGLTVSQSSTLRGVQGPAWRAMDGLNCENGEIDRNHSHTESESKPWWQIDFGAPVRVGQLDMTWRTDDASAWSDGVKNLRLLGSNDGENFTPLASFEYDKHALAVTTVELVPPVAYRYYRIAAQDYGYLIIGELEFTYRR